MAVVAGHDRADLREPAGWRRTKNRVATILMWVAFVVVIMRDIFRDVSTLPPKLRMVLQLNPMVHVIGGFRAVLSEQAWPDWWSLGGVVLFSLAVYALALSLLKRFDRVYPKLLVG